MSSAGDRQFGRHSTTAEVLDGLKLDGLQVLITGGSSGLGAHSARALAAAGARVVLTARDRAKGEAVASSIREQTGNAAVEVAELELADLAAVRASAAQLLERCPTLDLLINNAGVMACPQLQTRDGFELQFGTNHLGHFLLTGLLAPALLRAGRARVVNLSSRGHHITGVDLDDPNFERRGYDKWQAYGQSKTANILFSVELERRLGPQGVHAYAVHPGVIQTELMRHLEASDREMFAERARRGELPMKSLAAGCATQVYAATAPELEGRGGVYLEHCQIAPVDDESFEHGVRSYAIDAERAAKLWALSERSVGHAWPT